MSNAHLKSNFILSIMIFLIAVCFSTSVRASEAAGQESSLSIEDNLASGISNALETGYEIKDYDIKMNVDAHQVFYVTEKITAVFYKPKHGIYRDIPRSFAVKQFINQKEVIKTYRGLVQDISVTDPSSGEAIPFTKGRQGNQFRLKVGDQKQTLTGERTYIIHYRYVLSDDKNKQMDVLCYPLIGKWDTHIKHLNFTIHMPKAFDTKAATFVSNTETQKKIQYHVTSETISGNTQSLIESGEELILTCELPEGYFIHSSLNREDLLYLFYGLAVLLCTVCYFFFGKNPRGLAEVDFNLLKEMNPAEAGYILGGSARTRGIAALILHWANKGYLHFEGEGKDFTIVKQLEPDSTMKTYERLMFSRLFDGREQVTSSELKYRFYPTLLEVSGMLHRSYTEKTQRIFTAGSYKAHRFCYFISGLCITLAAEKVFEEEMALNQVLLMGWTMFMLGMFYVLNWKDEKGKGIAHKLLAKCRDSAVWFLILFIGGTCGLFGLLWETSKLFGADLIEMLTIAGASVLLAIFFTAVGWMIWDTDEKVEVGKQTFEQGRGLVLTVLVSLAAIMILICLFARDSSLYLGIFSAIICGFFGGYSKKRTQWGSGLFNKLTGLKQFIKIAVKEGLPNSLEERQSLFYEMLPFAYTFGLLKEWAGPFEKVRLLPPVWYDSSQMDAFSPIYFSSLMWLGMNTVESNMKAYTSGDVSVNHFETGAGGNDSGGGGSW